MVERGRRSGRHTPISLKIVLPPVLPPFTLAPPASYFSPPYLSLTSLPVCCGWFVCRVSSTLSVHARCTTHMHHRRPCRGIGSSCCARTLRVYGAHSCTLPTCHLLPGATVADTAPALRAPHPHHTTLHTTTLRRAPPPPRHHTLPHPTPQQPTACHRPSCCTPIHTALTKNARSFLWHDVPSRYVF